ncbi:MAG: hypothetical protein A3H70_02185 [Candidatus Komeilibacteria bacterium RIFCSPLOWO2_02_FULL_48_11]|uniref:RNA polymerase sigma-70 domain-containing protein n=1 Tax=Candidatus Komeilibacteria bacterium RIFCSPLOWO2_02_FULL_48_11 TaxID=1798553 RepID=A0A1G2BS67_9BACT|nr:MAG: hypothetical protein A3H70_02185 [Candidatus Komeilibacteria bacterium RIFCSPLOWO2_02_FULL_48_11]
MINTEGEESLNRYLAEIAESEPLSSEEEVALARRIKKGDLEARAKLVEANLRFVVSVAREYQGRGVLLADLISAGNMGLMTAADRFDGTRGFKFISYAVWWIRQAIHQTLAEQSRLVRIPVNRADLMVGVTRFIKEWRANHTTPPTLQEIAAGVGKSIEAVRNTMQLYQYSVSLDAQFSGDNDNSLLDIVPDASAQPPDAGISQRELQRDTELALGLLDEREQEVLRLYYGFDEGDEQTLEQVGNQLGVTRERVRQIKEQALRKLRHPLRRGILKPHADGNGANPRPKPKRPRAVSVRKRDPMYLVACGHIKNSRIWLQLKAGGVSTIRDFVALVDEHNGDVRAMLPHFGIQLKHGSKFARYVSEYISLLREHAAELDEIPDEDARRAYFREHKYEYDTRYRRANP